MPFMVNDTRRPAFTVLSTFLYLEAPIHLSIVTHNERTSGIQSNRFVQVQQHVSYIVISVMTIYRNRLQLLLVTWTYGLKLQVTR